MIPEWMKKSDIYEPSGEGLKFIVRTMKSIGKVMAKVQVQYGHEKKLHLPAVLKLLIMVALILTVSLTQQQLVLIIVGAATLVYLSLWDAKSIGLVLRGAVAGAVLAFLMLLAAMLLRPAGIMNGLRIVYKVFLSVTFVGIFNHTTQWNHITGALRMIHVPGIFVFTLDITLKYIVLLGNLIQKLLTSMQLRAVGKYDKKYSSIGGVMGITFLRGAEMEQAMYEAMQCRGFTDDYKGI